MPSVTGPHQAKQLIGSVLVGLAIIAAVIALTAARLGSTSIAERETAEDARKERVDAAEERREQQQEAAEERREDGGGRGPG